MQELNILIPMAGRGERYSNNGYDTPKPLIEINNIPMIEWALNTLNIKDFKLNYIFIIRKYIDESYNNKLDILLKRIAPNFTNISIDYTTEGPASSCLLAKEYINNDIPLLICNCDQIMQWNGDYFINSAVNSPYDGMVVTYTESTPKNSYADIDKNGYVTKIVEKQVISNISLNGLHFWKKGHYLVDSVERMIESNERYNNEFYIGPSYNHMIANGLTVGIFHIPNKCHISVGVPSDLELFLKEKIS